MVGLDSAVQRSVDNEMSKLVYDRNHLFGLGSDTKTETENWPRL